MYRHIVTGYENRRGGVDIPAVIKYLHDTYNKSTDCTEKDAMLAAIHILQEYKSQQEAKKMKE